MNVGLHHVGISTPDIERALAFYRDVLGFEVMFDDTWERGTAKADAITGLNDSSARQIMLGTGGIGFIELFDYRSPTPAPAPDHRPVCDHGITHLCLQVEDLDAVYTRARGAGMEFHSEPQMFGQRGMGTVYGRDPDGNVVELHQMPDGHPLWLGETADGRQQTAKAVVT